MVAMGTALDCESSCRTLAVTTGRDQRVLCVGRVNLLDPGHLQHARQIQDTKELACSRLYRVLNCIVSI